ncbi:MAG: transcriptional regulator [Marinilabiliales bacterium]|nr:MAG: transcriptional regulator [Marinilabiliales bacterium]
MSEYKLDYLDRKILSMLSENARTPFLEIGRKCNVSGAAIHLRVDRLIDKGILCGSQMLISQKKIGYMTCAFIGIQVNLTSTSTHDEVFNRIVEIPEIVECHHISGKYSLLVKVYAKSNEHLKQVIVEKIQSIVEVTSTETFISLEEGFTRQLPIDN